MGLPFARALTIAAAALSAFVLGASPALATLIGQQLTVELISPNDGNLMLSDTVTAAGGGDILPADGSEIGAVMLSTEFIDLGTAGGDQIVLGLEAGAPGGLTGYGDQARYVLSGIYTGMGMIISSVAVTETNITGTTVSFDDHSITVFIDDLVIGALPDIDSGSVTLDLTLAIPEPGTAALVAIGLAALARTGRRGRA